MRAIMITTGLIIMTITAIVFSIAGMFYSRGKKLTPEQFISARNTVSLSALIATIVASSMGAWILFSPAETGATAGLAGILGYALGSASAAIIFIWLGRVLRDRMPGGYTLTEFVGQRYGRLMYVLVLLIMTFYMGVYLSAELTGIALASQLMFHIPFWVTSVLIGAATLSYTVFGGIQATVFTDRVQSMIILPLLAVLFVAAIVFLGDAHFITDLNTRDSALLNPLWPSGLEFGASLIIAIVAAELFNQGNWQRVYLAKDTTVMKKGFLAAGLIILPVILIAGSFGFFAAFKGQTQDPSVSLFAYVMGSMPAWTALIVLVLAVALIMSSMDTLLNGLVSLYTVNFVRLRPQASQRSILIFAKLITIAIAGAAVFVSTKGWSVLYLFLVADLVCAAAVFPVFYGLFSRKHSSWSALVSIIIGIVLGALVFPDPGFSQGNLLYAFAIALGSSLVVSVILTPWGKPYEMERLKENPTILGSE